MSQKTDAELTTEAQVIRDETTELANTKLRVYNILKNIIDSKPNNSDTHFKGVYVDETALTTAHATADSGDYAFVDAGAASPVELWIWDEDDTEWVQSGATGGTVLSVAGTTNRITSTGGATPVIDISATYDAAITSAINAKVADAINDGTTTVAPSQNAVFDALALKEATANKGASGGYVGMSGFSIAFKNLANTFTSLFQNAATAVRTYTFQDRSGTIADDTDLALKRSIANTAGALTDGGAITITGTKHTLTTTQATITFSDSFTGDFTDIDVTFNTTAATWTFMAGSLCVVEGSSSGDNTATIAATSGDKIVISIWFVSSGNYRIAIKNFGQ